MNYLKGKDWEVIKVKDLLEKIYLLPPGQAIVIGNSAWPLFYLSGDVNYRRQFIRDEPLLEYYVINEGFKWEDLERNSDKEYQGPFHGAFIRLIPARNSSGCLGPAGIFTTERGAVQVISLRKDDKGFCSDYVTAEGGFQLSPKEKLTSGLHIVDGKMRITTIKVQEALNMIEEFKVNGRKTEGIDEFLYIKEYADWLSSQYTEEEWKKLWD